MTKHRLGIVCVAVWLVMSGSALAATPVWTVQPTLPPAGGTLSTLNGVSCPTRDTCTAVGNYVDPTGATVMLVEHWAKNRWTIQTSPSPVGATSSNLASVSCASLSACTAVGSYTDQTGTSLTLAESWNGTQWRIQATPPNLPAATGAQLRSVSCTSAGACTAVGDWANAGAQDNALAERWNGVAWQMQATQPVPSSTFTSVSCSSASACVAVGSSSGVDAAPLLAEVWNGVSWRVRNPVIPAIPNGAQPNDDLNGISCTTNGGCTAVGYFGSQFEGTQETLAEHFNGTSWQLQPTPDQLNANNGLTTFLLQDVSCMSARACLAVGLGTDHLGAFEPMSEIWNGSSWRVLFAAFPNPGPIAHDNLDGVSCSAASVCTGVGFNGTLGSDGATASTLVERYAAVP
jgi:hypothetical protein